MKTTPPCHPRKGERYTPPPKLSLPEPMTQELAKKKTPILQQQPSSSSQERVNVDDIWRQMDDMRGEEEDYSSSDDEDFSQTRKRRPVMVRLPCGDIHICGGCVPCPFLISNDDNMLVCQYSGVEYEPEHTDEYFDLNGGTGKRSGDPDQTCGEPVHGKWSKRVDPIAASRMAYRNAESMEDNDITNYVHRDDKNAAPVKRSAKRGALCVGEKPEEPTCKRGRVSKKNINDQSTCVNLQAEAESVLSKMINYKKASTFAQSHPTARVERRRPPPDPRMCDEKFVFTMSVKKYVRTCMANATMPSMDAIHNLGLMAQTVSAKARADAVEEDSDCIRTAKFRSICSRLIVSLWSSACRTPYMANAKRGTDAYR